MSSVLVEIVGWTGAALILVAYVLLTQERVSGKSRSYNLLNILGAMGVGFNSYTNRAHPSVVLNLAWLLIAVYGVAKYTNRKESQRND